MAEQSETDKSMFDRDPFEFNAASDRISLANREYNCRNTAKYFVDQIKTSGTPLNREISKNLETRTDFILDPKKLPNDLNSAITTLAKCQSIYPNMVNKELDNASKYLKISAYHYNNSESSSELHIKYNCYGKF